MCTAANTSIQVESPSSWPLPMAGTVGWSSELQQPSQPWKAGEKRTLSSEGLVPTREELPNGTRFVYSRLGDTEAFHNMAVHVEICRQGEDLRFRATVHNQDPEWTVRGFTFPILNGIGTGNAALLWPNGLGQRFDDLSGFGQRKLWYPSGQASMPWFALAEKEQGLYLGSHDPGQGARDIEATFVPETKTLSVSVAHLPFCAPGKSWTSPDFVIAPYTGGWQTAARHYRAWFDTIAQMLPPSPWVQNSSGWLLGILKQQNGDVMWDYRTGIDQLCDLAEAHGLNTLGLFGWAHGGHDYLYPEYIPDPLMGGVPALKAALARARGRGLRTVLYANGVIMDTSTDFYRYEGNDAILLKENSEPEVSSIRKFHSSTPVTFAKGCLGAERWRAQMLALAEQANALGADGILYDQIGVYGPACCAATNHRHATPATAFTQERVSMIREIAATLRTRNPQFIVMTEGIHDTLLNGISYVHGWGCGYASAGARHNMFGGAGAFPALFRATFPELPMTQRHPNPTLDRHQANYAAVHGLRHELESRYQADVRYLSTGKMPEFADYSDCAYYPPDVELIRRTDREEARNYLNQLIAFERRYAEFLWQGRFQGDEGFVCDNSALVANAYAAKDGGLAVCVWNPTDKPQSCQIAVPGCELTACVEPEKENVDSATPMVAESIRIHVYGYSN
jgi:hypothetical protein